MHPVVDDGYEFVDQNPSDISCKEMANCNRLAYHHDEFKLQRYGEREKKGSDQQLSLHFPLTEVGQSTFSINTNEDSHQQKHLNQLEQQQEEVFPCKFDDPIADYLDSMSNIYVKIFLSDESWFYHLFKPLSDSMFIPLFFGSRSRILSASLFLTWLHWKNEFT